MSAPATHSTDNTNEAQFLAPETHHRAKEAGTPPTIANGDHDFDDEPSDTYQAWDCFGDGTEHMAPRNAARAQVTAAITGD